MLNINKIAERHFTEKHRKHIIDFYNLLAAVKSPQSAETYLFSLIPFFKWVDDNGIDIYNTTQVSLDRYIVELNKTRAPRTVWTYIMSVKKFFSFLNKNGYNIEVLYTDLPKISNTIKYTLTDEQVKTFIDIVDYNFSEPYKTLLKILPYSGLRIDEVINLKLNDISKSQSNIYIIKVIGKGGKYREVPLIGDGNRFLASYLAGWRAKYYDKNKFASYLFPKVHNFIARKSFVKKQSPIVDLPLTYITIYKKVKEIAKTMGVVITPHTFRSTYATKLSNSGVNTMTIMKLLGHSSANTTILYDRPVIESIIDRVKNVNYAIKKEN